MHSERIRTGIELSLAREWFAWRPVIASGRLVWLRQVLRYKAGGSWRYKEISNA